MRAELLSVGTELLLGDIVDTNAAEMARRLAEIGVDVYRHTTVGDNRERLMAALREAVSRADVVVVTGGLGPTQDDITREAVAAVAGTALERRDDLVLYLDDYFARARRTMPGSNLRQADIPVGARVLAPVGTAAGFAAEVGSAIVYCLPGVPDEMRAMLARDVLPDLAQRGGLATTVSRLVRTGGTSEAAVAEACAPILERLDQAGNPTLAFLASAGETRVRITARAGSREQAEALLEPVVQEVVGVLGVAVTGLDDEGVEHAVGRQLRSLGWTLAVGESITGGGVGARLVRVPGASEWFRGGLLLYATDAKTTAGVDESLLRNHGPVSQPVAAALAEVARERLGADVGLGIVGVAGPAEQGGEPPGIVCLGVAFAGSPPRTRRLRLPARERTQVQALAAAAALDHLRRRLGEVSGPVSLQAPPEGPA